ncbi:hypothetical protein Golomagni_05013 [Golovinomyces magnicellulatus]|nr:hypothetical protein Golomagni_05013 [Golovinomyces magnicellulatus]
MWSRIVSRIYHVLLFAFIIDCCVQAQTIILIKMTYDVRCASDEEVKSSILNARALIGCKNIYDQANRRAFRICRMFPCIFRPTFKEFVEQYRGPDFVGEGLKYQIPLHKNKIPALGSAENFERTVVFTWNKATKECTTLGALYFNWESLEKTPCVPLKNLFRLKH